MTLAEPLPYAERVAGIATVALERLLEGLMAEQVPSIGRVVHFVHGDEHCAAIITAVNSRLIEEGKPPVYGQTLFVMPPMHTEPFSTVAIRDDTGAPATWHWPEYVAAK